MDDRVARLEARVEVLTDHVRNLELRVMVLEQEDGAAREGPVPSIVQPARSPLDSLPVQGWLALIGRTLVVLGGAFLLRALTDAHVFSAPVGVALGLLYGAPWLLLASRAGARGAQLDAFCHALATALIGYPLVWEATLRFAVLSPMQSAALLGALTSAALVLAALTRLHGLAWVVAFGACGSAAGLAVATGEWNSYTLLALAIGAGTVWLGDIRGWTELRWLPAAVANVMLLFTVDHGALTGVRGGPLFLALFAFAGYVGSFAWTTLWRTHRAGLFEGVQGAAIVLLAVGGSVHLLRPLAQTFPVAACALVLGASAYLAAFAFAGRHRDVTTFLYWGLVGLVLVAAGTAIWMGLYIASFVYAAGAAAAALAAQRTRSLTLAFHALLSAIAAAGSSGLIAATSAALLVAPSIGWRPLDVASAVAFLALVVAVVVPPVHASGDGPYVRIPRAVLVTVLAWSSMGAAVLLASSLFVDPRRIDPSTLTTLRTAVMVAASLALARSARPARGREAGWLMYPLLVATGIKLVFVDVPLGRPQTLFAAVALYGFALIVAPRLLRIGSDAAAARFTEGPPAHV